MAGLFAEYRPRGGGDVDDAARTVPPASLVIRDVVEADVDAVARIVHERDGGELAAHVAGLERGLRNRPNPPDDLLLAAVVEGRVVGFARARTFEPPAGAPANCAPAGWYLNGVTIAPDMRRRGVALALTRARMSHVARHADSVWCFTNVMNRASVDLHARLGFVEVTRDFWFPGVTFAGGTGILLRAGLDRP